MRSREVTGAGILAVHLFVGPRMDLRSVARRVAAGAVRAAALVGAAFLSATLAGFSAAAENERSSELIQLVVPWPAGGGADTMARKFAEKLGQQLKQTVIIQNIAGASGTIGTRFVTTAPPDGRTLLFASSEHAINQGYFKKLGYDAIRDFVAIGGVATQPFVVLAGAESKIATFTDLVTQSKAAPGKLTYASWGTGSLGHLGMELVKSHTGANLLHIPYKGSAQAMTDVVAGFVDSLMISFSSAAPQYKSGKVKLLAAATAKRFGPYAEVPTIVELGYPDVFINQWYGILARAGTPQPIVDRLASAISAAVETQEMAEWMLQMGLAPFPINSAQLSEYLQAEVAKWAKTMREANIAPE